MQRARVSRRSGDPDQPKHGLLCSGGLGAQAVGSGNSSGGAVGVEWAVGGKCEAPCTCAFPALYVLKTPREVNKAETVALQNSAMYLPDRGFTDSALRRGCAYAHGEDGVCARACVRVYMHMCALCVRGIVRCDGIGKLTVLLAGRFACVVKQVGEALQAATRCGTEAKGTDPRKDCAGKYRRLTSARWVHCGGGKEGRKCRVVLYARRTTRCMVFE